jgi:hypothetical protein
MRTQTLGSSSDDRLRYAVPGGISFDSTQRGQIDRSEEIPGWGSDLDPSVRPGVPRDKAPHIGGENLYIDVTPQQPTHRIHKSTEHGQLTPVFGTSCAPRGVSGRLRDVAYRYSEGRLVRWIGLMFADRVDMLEGVVNDVANFRPPNLVREMGLKSEWRYNRPRVIKAVAVTSLALAATWWLLRNRK